MVLEAKETNALRVAQRCPCYEEEAVSVAKQREDDV